MALSKALRDEVRKKLDGIGDRQLHNRIGSKALDAGVADRDLALLLIAREKRIDVRKTRFAVSATKLGQLIEFLWTQTNDRYPT